MNRPNTWWKKTYGERHLEYATLALKYDGPGYTPPLIYTKPEPRKQGEKGKR